MTKRKSSVLLIAGSWLLLACGVASEESRTASDEGTPSDDGQELCVRLSQGDLDGRSDAAQELSIRFAGPVVGGTEQQIEAAVAYCQRTFAMTPAWWSPPLTAADVQACRDVSATDATARRAALTRIRARVPLVEGGTEQQIEAANAFCQQTFGDSLNEE